MRVYNALIKYKGNRNQTSLFKSLDEEIAFINRLVAGGRGASSVNSLSFTNNEGGGGPSLTNRTRASIGKLGNYGSAFVKGIQERRIARMARKNVSNNLRRRARNIVPNTVANKNLKSQRFLNWIVSLPANNNRNNAKQLYDNFSQRYVERMAEEYDRRRRAPRRQITSNEEEWLKSVRNNTGERNRFRTYLTSLPKSNSKSIENAYANFSLTTGETMRKRGAVGLGKLGNYGTRAKQFGAVGLGKLGNYGTRAINSTAASLKRKPRRNLPINFENFVVQKGLNNAAQNRFRTYIVSHSVNNTRGLNNLYKNFRNSRTRQIFGQGVTLTPNKRQEIINKLVNNVNGRIQNFSQNRKIKLRNYLSKRKNVNKITDINKFIIEFKKFESQEPLFAKTVEGARVIGSKTVNLARRAKTGTVEGARVIGGGLKRGEALVKQAGIRGLKRGEALMKLVSPGKKRGESLLDKSPRAMWQKGITQARLKNTFTGVVPLTKAKLIKNKYSPVNLKNLTTFLSSKNKSYLLGESVNKTYKVYMNEKKIEKLLHKYHKSINENQLRNFMKTNPNLYNKNIENIRIEFRKKYPSPGFIRAGRLAITAGRIK